MIQTLEANSEAGLVAAHGVGRRRVTVWGLTPRELHDAYWRSRGVQCVRRGEAVRLDRAAELYLLLESRQLVLFDIAALSERLTWHNALITRLGIVDEHEDAYSERVVLDDRGCVQRIERRYRPHLRGSSRVILTSRRKAASLWMQAPDRRIGWKRVRRSAPWARVDHGRCGGLLCVEGEPEQEAELLDVLVERWPRPAQAIEGLEELQPGVWRVLDDRSAPPGVLVGPVWLGRGASDRAASCLVGPQWVADGAKAEGDGADGRPVMVRPVGQVEYAPSPMHESARGGSGRVDGFVKRAMDVLFSVGALVAFLPVMIPIAMLIKLEDGGPILFGHRRQTRGGQTFRCWKFRTMLPNAEDIARALEAYNRCDGPQVFIQDDPRVTRIGGFLRRTHLDEIPQFFNVLLGQMSIVGPRPSPDDENQYCPAWRDARLSVRPGITGLWQLKRRREAGEDFQEWIRYDIEYVQRAGVLFDLQIMVQTAWMMVMGRRDHGHE